MESLLSDVRYAIRNLIKRPGFTAIGVITLAIGIGANTAIFSFINALLLKPLPFPDLDRVVAVWEKVPRRGVRRNEVTGADYLGWGAPKKTFEQLGTLRWGGTQLSRAEHPGRGQGLPGAN